MAGAANPKLLYSVIYPTINQYIDTMNNPFGLLRTLGDVIEPERTPSGELVWAAGSYAVIFRVKIDGCRYALRCFLRDQTLSQERTDYISAISSPYIRTQKFLHDEIFVYDHYDRGRYYPAVLSQWVEGRPLNSAVTDAIYVNDTTTLNSIRYGFLRMADWLLGEEFAHGDIKPDNIIVNNSDHSLTLIDYDGMYIPGIATEESNNIGSPDFQHPRRSRLPFGKHIDDYPIALICISLYAVCQEPARYKGPRNSDFRLFNPADILSGRSTRFRKLCKHWESDLPLLAELCGMLSGEDPAMPRLRETISALLRSERA